VTRPGYILWRIATDLVSLFSRFLNAIVFGGSTAQTLSARCHLEAPTSPAWAWRRRAINALFFWDDDHCALAWHYEVERARYVLERLSEGTK
jgi:hypothetical protein